MKKMCTIFLSLFFLIAPVAPLAGDVDTMCYVGPSGNASKSSGIGKSFSEEITIDQPQSSTINKLNIVLNFPSGYTLFEKGSSYAKLSTADKIFEKKFSIESTTSNFDVNGHISADTLYLELVLYYSKVGTEGLCLVKEVVYKFPVAPNNKPGDLVVTYNVPRLEDK